MKPSFVFDVRDTTQRILDIINYYGTNGPSINYYMGAKGYAAFPIVSNNIKPSIVVNTILSGRTTVKVTRVDTGESKKIDSFSLYTTSSEKTTGEFLGFKVDISIDEWGQTTGRIGSANINCSTNSQNNTTCR